MNKLHKIIFWLFAMMLFFVPLVLWPFTSEVFEFNKMVLVYIFTTSIIAAWVIHCVIEGKFIFRRTILDIPILIFLGSQFVSTILSIDPLTSWLGYYSRFNGGLVSIICYSLLYWAFVSNFDRKNGLKLINFSIIPSAILVSLYGIAEHFGIDKNIWVQDVQSRVFSTLGQPNWLAAWLVALLPLTWALALESEIKNKKFWFYLATSILFYLTILFTKSRSGLLGFGITLVIFWPTYFWINRRKYKKLLSPAGLIGASILIISLLSGTEFTPGIKTLISNSNTKPAIQATGPALEVGGTESGTIRKIVWKGAVQVWLHYSIFGTGVETFAYSYYRYRPAEHNLVSEWDFIYNKAHNEFLNVAANTGTVGLISYLLLIIFSAYVFIKKTKDPEGGKISLALLAGYISLSATNFFGFSVVPTQLEFFLFPAIALSLTNNQEIVDNKQLKKISNAQIVPMLLIGVSALTIIFAAGKYWVADTFYTKGKAYNGMQKPDLAVKSLTGAIKSEPGQALYHNELATAYTSYALYFNQQKDQQKSKQFTDLAISESDKAIALSPANVNLKRSRFGVFIMLATIDPNYLINARDVLTDAITYAPTDAKLYYNLGLTYARTGQADTAITTLQKTVGLKANYADARLALAYLLIDNKNYPEAKTQLEYVLKNIDPTNSLAKQALESIK